VARITRKELKTDKFALEVGQTVTYFEDHRKEVLRYGAIAVAIAVLVVGILFYRSHQRTVRQQELTVAIQTQEASIGGTSPGAVFNFPTLAEKEKAAAKAFAEVASKYSGTDEGVIAVNYLGSIAVDQGKLDEAEKRFKEVADSGNKNLASLAKLSLAQLYFLQNRNQDGEAQLRYLIAHPTDFVSKEQATFTLARALAKSNPTEARRLVEPLRTSSNQIVSQEAITLYSQLGSPQ
jgi:predicted negative regulator of RcsB-dependent stress response